MKHTIILFAILTLLSCGDTGNDQEPQTAQEIKTALDEKRGKILTLEKEIKGLENKMRELDPTFREEITHVTVDTVDKRTFVHTVDIQGTVMSEDQVNASSEIGGNIVRLYVEEGQYVKRGQLIAKVDVSALSSQKKELLNQLSLAKELYERQKRLWDQEIGTEVQYLQAKNRVENLEKTIATLETNMSKANVYAPHYGIVELLQAKQGEIVGPGQPIAVIINNANLKVVAEVPEKYLPYVSVGDEITVRFPTLNLTQKVKISRVGASINPGNRTFKVEAPLRRDKERLIKPYLLSKIEIVDFAEEDQIFLPTKLLQQEVGGKNFVFTARADSSGTEYRAEKVYVEAEDYYGDIVLLEGDGLVEGDLLIASGARGMHEDAALEIISDSDAETLLTGKTEN